MSQFIANLSVFSFQVDYLMVYTIAVAIPSNPIYLVQIVGNRCNAAWTTKTSSCTADEIQERMGFYEEIA